MTLTPAGLASVRRVLGLLEDEAAASQEEEITVLWQTLAANMRHELLTEAVPA